MYLIILTMIDGFLLRERLKNKGITLSKLSEQLNLSPQALNSRLNAKDLGINFINDIQNATGLILIDEPEINLHTDLGKKILDSIRNGLNNNESSPCITKPRIPYTAAAGSITNAVEGISETQCDHVPVIYNYHKRLKPYINEAVSLGIIDESPYLRFKAERGKHKPKEALNEEELAAVRALELFDESLGKARDLFVFCCYTGLAHADMEAFDFSRDVVTVHGCNYIDKQRIKTGTKYYAPILPPAMAILEKYHYQLPHFSQQAYNRLLKCIGALINTKKNLSSHIARYTFATTVLLGNDVPIESVSKMMGHTRIQITQVYAKILNSSIERQAERLANIL